MSISNLELLRHIAAETSFVLKHTLNISKEDFLNDDLLCHALVRSIEIIGEASKKIDPDFKYQHPILNGKRWLAQETK